MTRGNITVAVGLSGGVDSSVAAWLLKEKGYKVVGLCMRIYDPTIGKLSGLHGACFGPGGEQDIEIAAGVCRLLDIPFHCIDLKTEFKNNVLEYFRHEYLSGKTPNPCVVCNNTIKFRLLIKKAMETGLSFDYFATGHYARVEKLGDRFVLARSADRDKDQTYFLYSLSQEQLSRVMFPIGHLTKAKVRELAKSAALHTSQRPESQDFLSGGNYSILFSKDELVPGEIIDEEGNVLGRHKGIVFYTVGQRRGLGISSKTPLYVIGIDRLNNRIVVGTRDRLLSKKVIVRELNYISISALTRPMQVTAKIRYKHQEAPATLYPHGDDKALLVFNTPQRAVTPGQSAVFYSGDHVVGGGIIEEAIPE